MTQLATILDLDSFECLRPSQLVLPTALALINERDFVTGHLDEWSDWWPQAEAVVGFFNAWQLSGDRCYLDKVYCSWKFIKENLVDNESGEWFWSVSPQGEKDRVNDKAGFWKCPYHNSRMCLELIERIKEE